MNVGKRIHELRLQQGWTQEVLAQKIFVTKQAISKWENGVNIPNAENLEYLQKVFHVSLSSLLGEENSTPDAPLDATPDAICTVDADLAVEYLAWCQCNSRRTLKVTLLAFAFFVTGLFVTLLVGSWLHPLVALLLFVALISSSLLAMYIAPKRSIEPKFDPIEHEDFALTSEASSLIFQWKERYEGQARSNGTICVLSMLGLLMWYLDTAYDRGWTFSIESTILFLVGFMLIFSMCMPLAHHWHAIQKLLHEVAPLIPTPFDREFWNK